MKRQKLFAKFTVLFFVFQLIFLLSAPLALAQADDIVIQGSGAVVLIITGNNVLGETTKSTATKKEESPKTSSGKVVPLTSQTTQSTVHIDPKPTKDKQINVSITSTSSKPQSGTAPSVTNNPAPNSNTINKVVNKVIAQDAKGETVFSVKPNTEGKVTLQQGTTEVSTSLPLDIDSKTRTIQVVVGNQPTKLSVLPTAAVTSVTAKGLVTVSNEASINTILPQVSLVAEKGQLEYQVKGERAGKLLGILPVKTPVQVAVSAQTGNTLSVSQSPLFSVFGFLIK